MYVSDEEWDGTVIYPVVKKRKVEVGVPVASVAVAAPVVRTIKKTKRYDLGKKWFDKTIKKGKKVGKTEKGVWRRVPGFPKRTIRVSSEGWLRHWSVKEKRWKRPKRGCAVKNVFYLVVKVHNKLYLAHKLINRAFHGAPPTKKHSTDHIAKRDDGDKEKERQDNRAKNLRWATQKEQSENQTRTDAPYADDRPLEVRSVWPRADWKNGVWVRFQSQGKATAAMGVSQQSVSRWLSRTRKCTIGWRVRWAEPDEPQCDLPATATDPAEVWIKVDDTTSVSNIGRALQRYRKSKKWRMFTPRATEGSGGYPMITVGGKKEYYHVVVFDAFFPGVRGDLDVDHKNRDRGDCRLSNLRALTRSDNCRNRTLKPLGDGNNDSRKTRLRYRRADAPDDAPWEKCLGANELARRLTDATGKTYGVGNISEASNGKYNLGQVKNPHKYKDYVFYKVGIST
jgi:hypothetical protein